MTTVTSQASNMASAASPSGSCLKDSRFSCNICLDPVAEPVVTQCGHLYCWSCLYRWLEPGILPEERNGLLPRSAQFGNAIVDTSRRRCPVCKSECSVPTLIPLYVRNDQQQQEQTQCTTIKKSRRDKRSSMKRKAVNSDQQQQSSDEFSISTTEDDHSMNSLSDYSVENQDGTSRRRLRLHNNHTGNEAEHQDGTNNNHNNSEIDPFVPSRPPAPSPLRRSPGDSSNATATASNNHRNIQTTPRHVNPISSSTHRPSLSHGLALSLWQTLFCQERRIRGGSPGRLSSPNSTESSSSSSSSSLDQHQQQQQFLVPPTSPEDGQTAEFLSRLLVMLGSFVIFCLVWF